MAGAWKAVDQLLRAAVTDAFPDAQLLVVDQGELVFHEAVGNASTSTRFDLASLTKPFCTAALVLRLVAQGKLRLEDRPRSECTIEQLLCHAGGLLAVKPLADPADPSELTRATAIEAARTEPLVYEPGTRSVYSDLGFILLGDAIERATGERLDDSFIEQIAAPAEAYIGFGPLAGNVAPTEGVPPGEVHDANARAMQGIAGHAGLFGRARSVSQLVEKWVNAWHGDASIFEPPLVRRAWDNAGIPGSTWGLGWDHPSIENSSAGASWPRSGVGHLGFTGCSVWIDPPRKRWVILLSNRVHPSRTNENIKVFRPRVHDAIFAALEPR